MRECSSGPSPVIRPREMQHPQQPHKQGKKSGVADPQHNGSVADRAEGENPCSYAVVAPKSTVEDWARRGVVPSRKIGRRRIYVRYKIEALLLDDEPRAEP